MPHSNSCRPQIVAAAAIGGTHTHVRIISDNGHRAGARAVRVVRLVPTADSRIEGLHLLLKASNSHHCIAHTYLIQPLLVSAGFPKK